ncbi:hypothetical protein CXT76_00245 [Candidatus Parvarchaeota archaeon]|nr:MAG: hypothetical protein CXT76_00245 [Candidatus Parvarchaeota archaeon]
MRLDDLIDFEEIFSIKGLKVVDTSFIGRLNNFFDKDSIEEETNFYEGLVKLLDDEILFPEETLIELKNFTNSYKKHAKRGLKQGRSIDSEGGFYLRNKVYLEDLKRTLKALKSLGRRETKLINKVFKKHPAEEYISRKSTEYLENILDSVIEISKRPGIMRSCERYNNYNPSNITDQKIFAKAVAISEDRPVTILTKDNDFQRIQSTFSLIMM